MLGTEIVAKSPADGYTLLIVAAAHSINPSLYAKVNYHPDARLCTDIDGGFVSVSAGRASGNTGAERQ